MQPKAYLRLLALMALSAIPAAIIWPHIITPISPRSPEEKVSTNTDQDLEIQRLTQEKDDRRKTADRWDMLNITATFFAGLAATCLVITSIGVSRSNGRLVRATDDVSTAKEAKFGLALSYAQQLADEARRTAEAEAIERLRLEAVIAPRRLSEKQKSDLASLMQFAGRVIQLKSYSADTEGFVFATQIGEALGKSKLQILDNRLTMVPTESIVTGVMIEGPNSALVEALKKALAANAGELSKDLPTALNRGITTSMRFGTMGIEHPPAATIIIGVKPVR